MKAWLIHTTRDLGNQGPDYMYGYGAVDAVAAVDLIKSTSNYAVNSISQGETYTHIYQVPIGAGEFKVSLAWDDYAAAPFVANALVNNLDLEVRGPDGSVHYPYSLNPLSPQNLATAIGPNNRDNQEQVLVHNPTPGDWTIYVRGTSVPESPQSFALAYSHKVGLPGCYQALNNGDFEAGSGGWVLFGASRVASPGGPPNGGSWSLQLGGSTSSNHSAYQTVSIPAEIDLSANLGFNWYMTTEEGGFGHGWDIFYAEVRDTIDNPLAVFEMRNDGWLHDTWLTGDNIDLTPFAGQTIRVAFYATNDYIYQTTFYVDDIRLWLCKSAPDLSIVKRVLDGHDPNPGDPITFTLSVSNLSEISATGVVVTDALSTAILTPTWEPSSSLVGTTERPGAPFVWDLPDLPASASGVITVYGVLDPALPPDFSLANVAIISTSDLEADTENNRARAVVGLKDTYLPLIFKDSQ
jgi:uncharacterized repeat protein (TIGR01451 family)